MTDHLKPQARTVLAMLRDRPTLSGLEALQEAGIYRLASRINELRRLGFDITTDRSEGYGRYRLVEPDLDVQLMASVERFVAAVEGARAAIEVLGAAIAESGPAIEGFAAAVEQMELPL